MFKVNNKQYSRWRRSGTFIINFEHILYLFNSVSFVAFEHVSAFWEVTQMWTLKHIEHIDQVRLLLALYTLDRLLFLFVLNRIDFSVIMRLRINEWTK